jgi:beta-phosphoglucomutase
MLRGMIFDMDGVLFDSHPIHRKAWRELLRGLGKVVSDQELDFILDGPTREQILHHFLGTLPQDRIASYVQKKDLLFRREEENLRTVDGVESFLATADAAGIPKVIATSASRPRAQRMLSKHGLIQHFDAVLTGDDVSNGKADPSIFLRSAEKMDAAPSDVIVFEDAPSAIRVATSVGMNCVGIAQGRRVRELKKAGADLVVSDFMEVSLQVIRGRLHGRRCANP